MRICKALPITYVYYSADGFDSKFTVMRADSLRGCQEIAGGKCIPGIACRLHARKGNYFSVKFLDFFFFPDIERGLQFEKSWELFTK